MFIQKRKEQNKEFEKQERKIRELKASGKSTKQAVKFCFLNTFLCLKYNRLIFFINFRNLKQKNF